MICPKCNIKLNRGCCIKCGYMENGNTIKLEETKNEKFEYQKLFNKNFDAMYRNEKIFFSLILGPLYFSYRGHFIFGTILVLIDAFLFYFVNAVFSYMSLYIIWIFLYILLNRLLYATLSNSICLFIDDIRIKQIKKKYKEDYIYKLEKYKHRKIYLLLTILFYIVLIGIIMIINR